MKLPNFLIIGAAKAGTTALHFYLEQHPQIYMSSVKETKFFVFENQPVTYQGPGDREANQWVVTQLEAYHNQFKAVTQERAIGESSPLYLYHPRAPERIQHYIPDVKLIAILRNPVDRAYSSFLHLVQEQREWITDFAQALQEEDKRIADNWALLWHYKQAGLYYGQLKRYFDRFSPDQIQIYLYEDLCNSPEVLLQNIFEFLDVDPSFTPNLSQRHNVSLIPKNRVLNDLLTQPNLLKTILKRLIPKQIRSPLAQTLKAKNLSKPTLQPQLRQELIGFFRADILQLQNLIQRDLSPWLSDP
jgi:hypothetical protein